MNKGVILIALSVSIAANMFLAGMVSTMLLPENNEVNVRPVVNVTEEVYNRTIHRETTQYVDKEDSSPIHNDVEFNLSGDELEVEDVDSYGEIYGSSMEPTLFNENTVIVREYTTQDIDQGDIVRYSDEDNYVIHRVTGDYEDEGYVMTKGDNNVGSEKVLVEDIEHIIVGVLYT